jgi:ribosomal protein S18 acetylase RimI-like enzyme
MTAEPLYLPPRPATSSDLDVMVHHRVQMFADMGFASGDGFAELSAACRNWFADAVARGRYLGWLIAPEDEPDAIAAGAGMLLQDMPPGPRDIGTTRAYILNVYTEPEHRGRGLATIATRAALDEARRRRIRIVTLHASDQGQAIYDRLGFEGTSEMRLLLDLDE